MLPDWYVSLTCMSEVLTGVGWSFRGVEEEGGVCVCVVCFFQRSMEFSYRGLSLSPPHQPVFLSFRITAGAGKPNANKHKCCVVQWCRGKYHSFSLSQFFPLLLLFTLICLTVFFMTLHKWQACLLEEFYCEIKQHRCRNHSHARLLKMLLFFKKISCCSSCLTFLRIIRFVWLKNHFGCWRSKTFSHPVPLPFFYSSAGKCCQRGENIFREAPLWEHPRNKQDTAHTAHTHAQKHTHTHTLHKHTLKNLDRLCFSSADQLQ